jgi:hypothetical protein
MKKLVFVVVLILIGWVLYLTLGVKEQQPAKTEQSVPAPTHPVHREEVTSGAKLDTVFPPSEGDYKITFTQEKIGFAEADLSKGGVKLAALTVSDTEANPSARDKFNTSTKKIGEFPVAANGSQGTALLAGNRYQVQVRSLAPTFTEADREGWLQKFKLARLAEMK